MNKLTKKTLSVLLSMPLMLSMFSAAAAVQANAAVAAENSETDNISASDPAVKTTLSSADLSSYYSTNKNGVGVEKTITVDGDISDWDSTMIIAQGAANDDPRVYRPDSMNEVSQDLYTLYGAYDDTNLYLMWEMTNVQDVVAPDEDYPLSQGVQFNGLNLPFFIAIDTKQSDAVGNSGKTAFGKTIWDSGISFKQSFNRIIAFSTNSDNGPLVYGGNSSGLNPVEMYTASSSGIVVNYDMGILSGNVYGIEGAYGEENDRAVGDMCNASSAWVDFNDEDHNSSEMDFHYEMSVPLTTLGIKKSDIQNSGIGALVIMSSGRSGMDCLPYDLSMNDNADIGDSASLERYSFEKSDEDYITTMFAGIGKKYEAAVDVTSVTLNSTSLSLIKGGTATLTATVAPSNATDKSITWSSSKTSVATVSSSGKVTAVAAGTATITATSSNGKNATCKVTVTDNEGDLVNNSYINSTGITLGSRVYFYGAAEGGSGSYKYAFYYKRTTSSIWKLLGTEYGTADNTFMTPTSTGDFDIKISVKDTKNAVADKTFSVTVSDGKSTAFKNNSTINTTGALPGTKIKLTAAASGSSGYKYAFYYKRTTARAWYISGTEFGTATTAQFTPKTEGEFNVKVDIMDKNGDIVSRQFAVSISNDYKATTAVNNSTISTNSAVAGTKITVTGAASGGTSPYKYAFYYKKAAANNWTTMGTPFGSDTSRSVTLKNKGDYIFKVCVKDATGGMVSKNFDVEITATN